MIILATFSGAGGIIRINGLGLKLRLFKSLNHLSNLCKRNQVLLGQQCQVVDDDERSTRTERASPPRSRRPARGYSC